MATRGRSGPLEARRQEKGVTQEQIAAAVGRTQSTVQRWFATNVIPAKYQARVAGLIGARLGWVAGDGGPVEEGQGPSDLFAEGRRAGYDEAIRVLVDARADLAGVNPRVAKDAAARAADAAVRARGARQAKRRGG